MSLPFALIEFPRRSTEGLVLRELRATDAEAISSWKPDPEGAEPYDVAPHRLLELTRAWTARRLEEYRTRDTIHWIFTAKTHDAAVDSCYLWSFDPTLSCAEVGYEVDRRP